MLVFGVNVEKKKNLSYQGRPSLLYFSVVRPTKDNVQSVQII